MKKNFTFTNSLGDTFRLLPLNPLEQQLIEQQVRAEWQASGRPLPEQPVREAVNVAGEVQKIQIVRREHAGTPELEAAWDAYEAALTDYNRLVSERFMSSVFLCVDADPDAPEYRRWRMKMKAQGLPVPEDEFEKLAMFCKTWVVRSADDIAGLIFAVTGTVSNISEEARQAAEANFRNHLEKAYTAAVAQEPAG